MMRSLWTAASGMRAQQTNVDTIAHNLSNVNTIGYKNEQASFKSLLYQNLQSKSTNNAGDQKPVPAEVGLGSRVAAITSQFSQGSLLASDNSLSTAIEGDGFFAVRTADGTTQYSRDGGFQLSPTDNGNLLVNANGDMILDVKGSPIYLPKDKNAADLAISKDGTLAFPGDDGNPVPITDAQGDRVRIALYQFSNAAGLTKEGNNNYSPTVASGDPIPENGNANVTQSKIHQFYTEGSNVDVANEMVNLIVAQRAYEMNSKAIQTTDDMMQQANNLR